MPKLTEIANKNTTRTVTVRIGTVSFQVAYRPDVITPRFQKAVAAAQRDQDIDGAMLLPISQMLASWDLTDDDGVPVPTTPEVLSDMPARVLLTILEVLGEDMAPNPQRAGALSSGSPQTASSAPAQIGTSS